MHLSDLKKLHVSQLLDMALALEVDNAHRMRKQELMFAILKKKARQGEQIFGDGTLEVLPDGFGFLRSPDTSYLASTDDIYISPSQIRRFNLHTGDSIEGEVRTPKDGERYFALVRVDTVNGLPPESTKHRMLFENLTPIFPNEPLTLERDMRGDENITPFSWRLRRAARPCSCSTSRTPSRRTTPTSRSSCFSSTNVRKK